MSGTELEQKLAKLFKILSKGDSEVLAVSTTPTQQQHQLPAAATPPSHVSASLLLELAFLCMENSLHNLAKDCLRYLPKEQVQSDGKQYILRELLHTHLQIVQWDSSRQLYSKPAVEMRISKINQLEEIVKSAIRLSDPDIIQVSEAKTVVT